MNAGPPLVSSLVRSLAVTWDIREQGETRYSVKAAQAEPRIYVYWHEFVLPAVGVYRDLGIHPFASKSFDGELICRTMSRLGFGDSARGSSSRGGAQGLLELKRFLEAGQHVAITVDGPRGPRRVAQEGAVKLAQLSGFAMVPFCFASKRAFRLKSWDRMILPGPWMRGVINFGQAIQVPRELSSLKGPTAQLQGGLDLICREIENGADSAS
jgi:lysophospholipid acyltransferase (LPLAT)-like uncharacterized protein